MIDCPKCKTSMEADARFCPECGHPMTPAPAAPAEGLATLGGLETLSEADTRHGKAGAGPELSPGERFADRYVIEAVVGRGGMGVVYKAADTLTNQTIALKLIRPERLSGANAVDRLIAEGVTARNIRHRNVVAVYDVAAANGQPFVSMEFLDGQSLRSWHRRKVQAREDVPVKVAGRIMAEILEGLKAAHDAGVVHRDLKPENVILSAEPTADAAPLKLLDFGIARVAGAALESGTGTGLGTPRYMAPEQITNADAAGPSADLYSLSVMFYELLVDVLPQGHWQPPSGGRPDVPKAIDALIEKGLSNRPASRPQSADAYATALSAALAGVGPAPAPEDDAPPRPPEPPPPKKPLNMRLLAGVGIVVLGVAAVAVLAGQDPEDNWDPCPGLTGIDWERCMYPDDPRWAVLDDEEDLDPVIDPPEESVRRVSPSPPPSPPPPPPPNRYASLNGEWHDGLGTVYDVTISRDGAIRAEGGNINGDWLTFTGSFSGDSGTYRITSRQAGLTLSGRLQWDGQCHVGFQTFDASGTYVAAQGQMHVNHLPGAPCP